LSVLTSPKTAAKLIPQGVDDAALADARGEVAKIKSEHDDLVRRVGAGELSAAMAAGAEPQVLERLALAEQRVSELVAPAGLRSLVEPGAKVTSAWASMPMSAKREVVRLLFAPGVLGVLSVARGRNVSTLSRIRLDGAPL
jgi:hypothetical protein